MYLKEFEKLEVILKNYRQPSKWEKDLGFKPELNKSIIVHWSLLKTKRDYRTKFIKVKCDDCGIIFERRIRDLDPNKNYHLCRECQNKGDRNGQFGKPMNENFKKSYKKLIKDKGNPFTWDSSKQKIKNKLDETVKKIVAKTKGQKRNQETKEKMSLSAIKAFEEGRRKPSSGWGRIKIKQYNGLDYQSSYELKFLKFVEDLNKFNIIERGPRISYFDTLGKEHNYYIDYRIKGTDVVFEIKSDYLWNKNKDINEIKMKEAKKLYNYNLVINNNFKNIKKIFENHDQRISNN